MQILRGYVRNFCGRCRFYGGVSKSLNLLKDFESDSVTMDGEFIGPSEAFVPFDVAIFLKSGKVTLHSSFAHDRRLEALITGTQKDGFTGSGRQCK